MSYAATPAQWDEAIRRAEASWQAFHEETEEMDGSVAVLATAMFMARVARRYPDGSDVLLKELVRVATNVLENWEDGGTIQ